MTDDTWEWSGADWTQRCAGADTCVLHPAARSDAAIAAWTTHAVMFGGAGAAGCDGAAGQICGGTWVWDGALWDRRCDGDDACGTQPSPRWAATAAFDPVRGVVVLYNGCTTEDCSTRSSEVWEWNGATWIDRSAISDPEGDGNPNPFDRGMLVWDPARGRVAAITDSQGQVWEWTGSSWRKALVTDPEEDGIPTSRGGPSVALVPQLGGPVQAYGTFTAPIDDAWLWNGAGDGRPAHALFVPFASSGSDAAALVEAGAVLEVSAMWIGGATGFPAGAASDGARFSYWDRGGWREGASNAGSSAAPTGMTWSTATDPAWSGATPAEIRRLFFGPRRTLGFAVSPIAANGPGLGADGYGAVATDYVEIVVRYRR